MNYKAKQTLIERSPVDENLIVARFHSKYAKKTLIQCYAPTNDAEMTQKRLSMRNYKALEAKLHVMIFLLSWVI